MRDEEIVEELRQIYDTERELRQERDEVKSELWDLESEFKDMRKAIVRGNLDLPEDERWDIVDLNPRIQEIRSRSGPLIQEKNSLNRKISEMTISRSHIMHDDITSADLSAANFLSDLANENKDDTYQLTRLFRDALGSGHISSRNDLTGYDKGKVSNVFGELLRQRTLRNVDGSDISLCNADENFREEKTGKMREKYGEDYETIDKALSNFEGLKTNNEVPESTEPLIEYARILSGSDNGLAELDWRSSAKDYSGEYTRELIERYAEDVQNEMRRVFNPKEDKLYLFRGTENNIPVEDTMPLEYWTTSPVIASHFTGEEGYVEIEKAPLENILGWSGVAEDRYNVNEVILAREDEPMSSEYEKVSEEEFDFVGHIMKAADQIQRPEIK